jgi:hypothetical protein
VLPQPGHADQSRVVLSAYDYQFERSGSYFPTNGYHPPTLEVSGTADTTSPLTETESTYSQTFPPKYRALMLGAPHVDFAKPWGPVIDGTVVAFFNAYLAGTASRAAIMKVANVPGVSKGRFNRLFRAPTSAVPLRSLRDEVRSCRPRSRRS